MRSQDQDELENGEELGHEEKEEVGGESGVE